MPKDYPDPDLPTDTKRKPMSYPALICSKGVWQVCYTARGNYNGRPISAWVYGKDSTFHCEVGTESHLLDLPLPNSNYVLDDQFNFNVDLIDKNGIRTERLGGANSISAAIAVFQYYVAQKRGTVRLRHGIRVIDVGGW